MIPRFHVPLIEPEDVVRHLGAEERHWKEGRSAHALSHAWCARNGVPEAIRAMFADDQLFRSAELVDAFLERKIDIGSADRPSQTDLLAIIGLEQRIAVFAVEGKAGEPFGPLVSEWLDGSEGKLNRLRVLCHTLGIDPGRAGSLRYQLLHRTASAIYEAKRYRTDLAGMVVHSFAEDRASRTDFFTFAEALGLKDADSGKLLGPVLCEGVSLLVGWAQDEAPRGSTPIEYLDALHDYASRLSQWSDRVRAWCEARRAALG
jgi:hypothetical protein